MQDGVRADFPQMTAPMNEPAPPPQRPRPDPVAAARDVSLMLRIAHDQDREAFADLFERYARKVKAFLIAGGAPHDQADEVAQEVMVSVWRRAGRYDPEKAAVSTWIYAIARNRRIDMIRRESRPASDPEDPLFQPDPEPDPASNVAGSARDSLVRDALCGLPGDQREAVRLAFYQGLTQSEIAEKLDIPLGTVKSRLRLAFRRLRTTLGDDFSEELLE